MSSGSALEVPAPPPARIGVVPPHPGHVSNNPITRINANIHGSNAAFVSRRENSVSVQSATVHQDGRPTLFHSVPGVFESYTHPVENRRRPRCKNWTWLR